VLHVGPYSEQKVAIGRMQELAEGNGVHLRGPYHENYSPIPTASRRNVRRRSCATGRDT
jgi:hypothetical protein